MSNDREPVVAGPVAREPRADRHGTTVAPPRDATTDVSAIPPAVSRGDPGSGEGGPARPPWWIWFGGLLGLSTILLLAALWPRAPFALDVGMPGDRLFLANVHGDERVAEYSYRWTGKDGRDTILTVPGWGAVRRARLTVRAQALPDKAPIDVQVLANGVPVGTMRVDGTMAAHALEIAIPPGGADLALALRSPTTTVPGDSRQLGVKLDTIRLEPLAYDAGAYWRALGPWLAAALVLVALGLALTGGLAGAVVWAVRLGVALAVPLAAAVALPWTLALLPYASLAAVVALALVHRRRLVELLAAAWAALDRERPARYVAAAGVAIYLAVLLLHVRVVPWINHADYADNAVVARNLVQGRGFSVDYVAQFYRDYRAPRHPADTWPPLQPLLIAPFFALFGVSTAAAKLPNVFIMAALLLLVYRVGAALWSRRVGLLAATLLALQGSLFEGAVYPLNDVGFTFLAFGCLVLLWRLTVTNAECGPGTRLRVENAESGTGPRETMAVSERADADAARSGRWRSRWAWALLGVLGGLLFLAKPSGALWLAGGAAWSVWWAWRHGRLRPVLAGGLIAGGVAAAVVAPWLARNVATFGAPFYSTEQYDAWVLKYDPQWEAIYRVYAGRLDLPHPRLLVGYGFDRTTGAIWKQFRDLWGDLSGGAIAPLLALLLAIVGACTLAGRPRALLGAVVAAATPYLLFVLVYWHYEERYVLLLLPWAALLAAGGLWWLHDQLASARGARFAAVAALVALLALVVPQLLALGDAMAADRRVPVSVTVAEWIRDNTPADAVVMTRNPWELSFHSGHQAVMIPYDDLDTIEGVARRYGATYLQLDHLPDGKQLRPALAPLYDGRELPGFRKVYAGPDAAEPLVLVYQLTGAGR